MLRTLPRPAVEVLPTDSEAVADLLLTPGVDRNAVQAALIVQEGWERARRLLAEAHHIAADRLWNAA